MQWANASRAEKAETIRKGLLAGLSDSAIAETRFRGATKNMVISFRYNVGLSRVTAPTFELPPPRRAPTAKPRRTGPPRPRNRNEAINAHTRELVDEINASSFTLKGLAEVVGCNPRTIEGWRTGRWGAGKFLAQCVRDALR